MNKFPFTRLRRLRQHRTLRSITGIDVPSPKRFLWPVFIVEGKDQEIPIDSLPGQCRYSVDRLLVYLEKIVNDGIGGILLFAIVDQKRKDVSARYAYHQQGLIQVAIRKIRKEYQELLIFTDVCLCAYTPDGCCGVLDSSGKIANDQTLEILTNIALSHAYSGADGVAPSAMMDGQVASIRQGLEENGFQDTIIMSYSTKFASSLYGPFRDAAQSAPQAIDRKTYQAPYHDANQAIRESLFDEEEGADILMVKPSLFYLDILYQLRQETRLPLAVYDVSGQYAMISACAQQGWGNKKAMVREAIFAFSRAGADIIISYWANQYHYFFR